jgi:hypothetical protein
LGPAGHSIGQNGGKAGWPGGVQTSASEDDAADADGASGNNSASDEQVTQLSESSGDDSEIKGSLSAYEADESSWGDSENKGSSSADEAEVEATAKGSLGYDRGRPQAFCFARLGRRCKNSTIKIIKQTQTGVIDKIGGHPRSSVE